MEARRDLHVFVEALVPIRLLVTVQVVQASNLIASEDVDRVIYDLQAERLEDPGRVTLPLEIIQLGVDPADNPNVAAPGAHRRGFAILEEVHSADPHPGFIRVVEGDGDRVEGVWLVIRAEY